MSENVKTGTVEGTGSAINISLGFTPSYFKCWNEDDAGSIFSSLEWWSTMPAASALKTGSITDNATTTNKSSEKITSNGISAYAGSTTAAVGVTIGADADLNASGETIHYVAVR